MTARSCISPPDSIPRAALVTGAGIRIGRAIALALAEAGFAVALHARKTDGPVLEVAASVRAKGVGAVVLAADLAREAEVETILPRAEAALGPVGVLVNSAAIFERDEWDSVTRASWDAHLDINLRAPFVLTQAFARALPASAEGVVVNLIDQRIWSMTQHFMSYSVAKFGLWGLTQSLALALAPRIRVNGIGPGPALPSPRQSPAQFERQARGVPLGHGTSPEEVARAVLAILALPAMTGQMIALDGGQHLQWYPRGGATPEE